MKTTRAAGGPAAAAPALLLVSRAKDCSKQRITVARSRNYANGMSQRAGSEGDRQGKNIRAIAQIAEGVSGTRIIHERSSESGRMALAEAPVLKLGLTQISLAVPLQLESGCELQHWRSHPGKKRNV